MDTTSLIQASQIETLTTIHTEVGKQALHKGLRRWSDDVVTLDRRSNSILVLRNYLLNNPDAAYNISMYFSQIEEHEEIFKPSSSESDWKNKTSEQIFFAKDSPFQHFNQFPGIISLFVALKVWITPALAIATPFIMLILPYFIMNFVYNIPIEWERYYTLILSSLIGETVWSMSSFGKILYFFASMSQAIIQPFLTAFAVKKLDTLVRDRAKKIQTIYKSIESILTIYSKAGIRTPTLPGNNSTSLYGTFAQDKDESWTTVHLGKIIGEAEVIFSLAIDLRFQKPIWVQNDPILEIQSFSDLCISNAKKSSVCFTSSSHHSLLTGPNRGGKSSNMRGILQNVLWAQTYGVAPSIYKGQPFKWVVSSLRVEDRPGISSLFEREIEIAVDILNHKNDGSLGLVLVDEIFHSTNPPDGERTARIFLSQLWKMKNVVSCVSTHVYEIVEDSPKDIQKLCCYAEENDDDQSIRYDYVLRSGICKVSSVNDVLREKGLATT